MATSTYGGTAALPIQYSYDSATGKSTPTGVVYKAPAATTTAPVTTPAVTTTAPKVTAPTTTTPTNTYGGTAALPTQYSYNSSTGTSTPTGTTYTSPTPIGVQTTAPASSTIPVAPLTPAQTATSTPSANAGFNAATSPTYTVQPGDKYNPYTGQPLTSTTPGTVITKTDSTVAADAAAKAAKEAADKTASDAAAKAYQEWVTRQNEQANTAGTTTTPGATPTTPTDTSYQGLLKQAADQVSYARAEQQKAADLQAKADQMATELNKAERNVDTQRIMQESAAGQKSVMERTFGLEAQQANVAAAKQAAYAQAQQTGAGTLATLAGLTPQALRYGGAGAGGTNEVQPTDPFYKTLEYYAWLLTQAQGSIIPPEIKNDPVFAAQLDKMARALDPNYNPNISAAAGTVQAKAADIAQKGQTAKDALASVTNAFAKIPIAYKTSLPIANAITGIYGWATGDSSLTAYKSALSAARIKLADAIQSAQGNGIDTQGKTVDTFLPENMSPTQIAQQIPLAGQFIDSLKTSYTSTGTNTNTSSTTSTVQYNPDGTLKAINF